MQPAPSPQPQDERARERIRHSLDESLIVEAAAGTGKTSELVRRIVNVLKSGRTTVDRVVAVTFTHKAAGELKLRLRQGLDRARQDNPDPAEVMHLEHALARLEEASIGTIHSFCAQILRERPVEARVDPAFVELSETEGDRVFERAFRWWIQHKLDTPAEGLRRALVRLAWRDTQDTTPALDQLKWAGRAMIEWRDFPGPWERVHFDRAAEIERMLGVVLDAAEAMAKGIRPVQDTAAWIRRAREEGRRDPDTFEALLLKMHRDMRNVRRKGTEALIESLEAFRRDADADLAWHLREDLAGLVDRYEYLKRQGGQLDFLDLLILARDLVRENAEVRAYLQQRFTHIFVDEFQDTDPLQAELLLLLAADDAAHANWLEARPAAGKLFVVGDPKQSIYKFRRADVVLYRTLRERLSAQGVGLAYLSRSFRATPLLQGFVNAAFEEEMNGDAVTGQADYVALEPHAEDMPGQPAVIALPAPRPYGTRNISKVAINACLPDAVAAYAAWLIQESGWTVRDPEGSARRVAISPRHIAILFRRFTNWGQDMTREYTRGLEARGVPHLLVGSRSFHSREEVETLRAALTAIEWPDDELSVFAALKGSLFAISDAALLKFRHGIGRLHPFGARAGTADQEHASIDQALDTLAELHRRRNHRAVAETVNLLMEATRAHAGFALRPGGHQVLANVNRIADLARTYEIEGGISFRGFVEHLEAQARKSDSAEALVVEEGAEGVRIMTVHAAKGLEFPVVILADQTANLSAREPERYVDAARGLCAHRLLQASPQELVAHRDVEFAREQAEGVRVAYVASTRARDLLVVPAIGDEEREGWLAPLNKAIYPSRDRWRFAGDAEGCPSFGHVSVLERPPDLKVDSVRPGTHQPRRGTHEVVWWDPGVLVLGVESSFGLRQEEVLAADNGESLAAYERWREARESLLAAGRKPEFTVFTPSETASAPNGFACEVSTELVPRTEGRPAGARFGALIHAILRDVRLDGDMGEAVEMARLHGRLYGATEGEIEAAWEAAHAALRHPVFQRARASEECRREWPMMVRVDDIWIEGIIDLAFRNGHGWTIVDFKTDEDFDARRAHYEKQVQWYAFGVARLTGLAARAVLFRL